MSNAHLPVEPTQSHQGGGARFFRRLGGAVRGVIAGGIALATRRRRSAAPPSSFTPPEPRPPRAPRRPRATVPPPPTRPGWLARFGLAGRLPAPQRRPSFLDSDAPFTPENHPDFSPEVCDFLNTPVAECDPNELYLALAVLAQCLAESLPPELGMDAKALFSTLWSRLGPPQADAPADDVPPPTAPAAPEQAEPDAPPPSPPIQPQDSEPADAAPATAASRTTPARVPPDGSAFRGSRSPFDVSPSFHRRRRSPVDRGRSRFRRRPPGCQQALPPRRLYYAACAGPP